MNLNQIEVYVSNDNRYRTAYYENKGSRNFCLSERTSKGVLVTEFNEYGQVINQMYRKCLDPLGELRSYLGAHELILSEAERYEHVTIKNNCKKCNNTELTRELDLLEPAMINDVPVVPIFVCRKCGKKFYAITDTYVRNLVANNLDLFEKEELDKRNENEGEFIKTLQEYIIRVFASKKIERITFDG